MGASLTAEARAVLAGLLLDGFGVKTGLPWVAMTADELAVYGDGVESGYTRLCPEAIRAGRTVVIQRVKFKNGRVLEVGVE